MQNCYCIRQLKSLCDEPDAHRHYVFHTVCAGTTQAWLNVTLLILIKLILVVNKRRLNYNTFL